MAKQGRVKQLDIICSQPSNNTLKSGLLSENGDRPSVHQKTKVPFLPYGGDHIIDDGDCCGGHSDNSDITYHTSCNQGNDGTPTLHKVTFYENNHTLKKLF